MHSLLGHQVEVIGQCHAPLAAFKGKEPLDAIGRVLYGHMPGLDMIMKKMNALIVNQAMILWSSKTWSLC
jgi:hypothetical protein